jgi:TonB family protein
VGSARAFARIVERRCFSIGDDRASARPVRSAYRSQEAARVASPVSRPAPEPRQVAASAEQGGGAARSDTGGAIVMDGDANGDWYLSGVQARIWAIWQTQLRRGFQAAAVVEFQILADGSVGDVALQESSDDLLVDLAAQRAIRLAAPFAPPPSSHGREYTVRAVFKPDA